MSDEVKDPLDLKSEEPKLFWVRHPYTRRPVACVAYKLAGNLLAFSLSIQNPKDTFDKKLGREIAQKRFAAGKHYVLSGEFDPYKAQFIITQYLALSSNFPKHLRSVAQEAADAQEWGSFRKVFISPGGSSL